MVKTYIVNYDLIDVKHYKPLYKYFRTRIAYKMLLKSCWAIRTKDSIDQVMYELKHLSDNDDEFFVYELPPNGNYRDIFPKDIKGRSVWLHFRKYFGRIFKRRLPIRKN